MKQIIDIPTRAEQAYAAIRESICDGTLDPGTHLVQEELAVRLGVSRQPVQQAMALLKNDGLVVERAGRGLYVAPLDPTLTAHRYQIRTVLDQLAAELVALRAAASPAFAAELRGAGAEILAAGDAAIAAGDHKEAVRHDVRFHSLIYDMSGNPFLPGSAEPHWHYLRRVMIGILVKAERGPLVWRQHREILDLLVSGNVEGSVEAVAAHVSGAEFALRDKIGAEETPSASGRSLGR
jgi:DNA-binding GntR family transcriptional regulator